MTATEHHALIIELFNEVVERPAPERMAYLERVCADPAVRREVESLLAKDVPSVFLDCNAIPGFDLARLGGLELAESADLPDQIGEFKILGLLGSGGMGIVYHAQQESPYREVALKLIRPELATPGSRKRFEMEIRALARLRHPGIAAIYAAATVKTPAGPQPYLVMEYVRGRLLLEFAREEEMSHRDRVQLVARLSDVIQYAHQQGVIHRDIKPANILVELTDGIPQPRVLDFGIARVMDLSSAPTMTTVSSQMVGTLAYMSPEQADGNAQAADTRSDVYSLGAVAYELLCGKVPIETSGASMLSAIKAVRETLPRPLAAHCPALRGDLDTILLKALAKDPDKRYASPGELAADLRRYLNNEPVLARKPSLWYTARKFTERHRLLVCSSGLILTVLIAGIAGTVYGLVQAHQSSEKLRAQVRDTSETASYLVQVVLGNLGTISGTDVLRTMMLERLNNQVDHLLEQTPNDPILIQARAAILALRSDIALAKGDCTEALDLRYDALKLSKSLASTSPFNLEWQADVSIALVKIGDVYKEQNDRPSAWQWYAQALIIDQLLASQHAESIRFVDNLGWSYHRLAEMAMNDHRLDEADCLLRDAETLGEHLVTLKPKRSLTSYLQWQTQHAIARVAYCRNDFVTAGQRYQEAFDIAHQLLSEEAGNRDYAIASAASLLGMAEVGYTATFDVATAIDEAAGSLRDFYSQNPHDGRLLRMLCIALLHRAQFAYGTGDAAGAIRACEEIQTLIDQADTGQARELTVASIKTQIDDLLPRVRQQLATQPAAAQQ